MNLTTLKPEKLIYLVTYSDGNTFQCSLLVIIFEKKINFQLKESDNE